MLRSQAPCVKQFGRARPIRAAITFCGKALSRDSSALCLWRRESESQLQKEVHLWLRTARSRGTYRNQPWDFTDLEQSAAVVSGGGCVAKVVHQHAGQAILSLLLLPLSDAVKHDGRGSGDSSGIFLSGQSETSQLDPQL